jgi:hypothetical protein
LEKDLGRVDLDKTDALPVTEDDGVPIAHMANAVGGLSGESGCGAGRERQDRNQASRRPIHGLRALV